MSDTKNPGEIRRWEDGSTITRAEADEQGLQWSHVCLYTEPVEQAEK